MNSSMIEASSGHRLLVADAQAASTPASTTVAASRRGRLPVATPVVLPGDRAMIGRIIRASIENRVLGEVPVVLPGDRR